MPIPGRNEWGRFTLENLLSMAAGAEAQQMLASEQLVFTSETDSGCQCGVSPRNAMFDRAALMLMDF